MATIAIAGAGVLGRLLAWRLAHAGHAVQVFDPAPGPDAPVAGGGANPGQESPADLPRGAPGSTPARGAPGSAPARGAIAPAPHAAGFTAAGMLSPLAELDNAGIEVAQLGWRSIALWREVDARLGLQDQRRVRQRGSLMVAHGSDLGAAQRVLSRLEVAAAGQTAHWPRPRALTRVELQELEPALLPDLKAWLLPEEGQVLPREMLHALVMQAPGVRWHWGVRAVRVWPNALTLDDGVTVQADLAIDVRGLGARDCTDAEPAGQRLRGVRGEVVWLHAPGVSLQRPVRLLHPRHRVYVVPRPGDLIVVGASEIESEDRSPVSLRSAVELMAAAHSVLPELAEARIVHLDVNLRPAWPDNLPRTETSPGLLRITGLFRHGWLLAPALVQDALARCPELSETTDV